MTVLASKADRLALGIDTLERAIVYAAILLRQAANSQNNTLREKFSDSIKIAINLGTNLGDVINIQTTLPYISQDLLHKGINILDSLSTISDYNPNPIGVISAQSQDQNFLATSEPFNIFSLEKYFVWSCQQLFLELNITGKVRQPSQYINIRFSESNDKNQAIIVDIALPFDYSEWLSLNNLIGSVEKIVKLEELNPELISFGNNLRLTNSQLIGN